MAWPLITLFTPANRPELFDKARRAAPDTIVIDLEDSVPVHLKAGAREEVAARLPGLWTKPLIRTNAEPDLLEGDLEAVVGPHVYGVVLTMVEDPGRVRAASATAARLERARGLPEGSVRFLLQIETALGVNRCYELATADPRVETVIFGSAEDGDLQTDLRCAWSPEGTEMLYARSKVLLDARAARLPYVLDGAFSDLANEANLRADCTLSRRLGYQGRTVIHPKHVAVAREIYTPGEAELDRYRRLAAAFEKAEADGLAAVAFEGKMIDYAMYKKARALLSGYGAAGQADDTGETR